MTQTSGLIVSEHSQKKKKKGTMKKFFCWVWWVVQGQEQEWTADDSKRKKKLKGATASPVRRKAYLLWILGWWCLCSSWTTCNFSYCFRPFVCLYVCWVFLVLVVWRCLWWFLCLIVEMNTAHYDIRRLRLDSFGLSCVYWYVMLIKQYAFVICSFSTVIDILGDGIL